MHNMTTVLEKKIFEDICIEEQMKMLTVIIFEY